MDLALLDVVMPGKSGLEICQTIKFNPETRFIPVVLVTGLSSVDERIRGIRAGADDFLSKPVNSQELLARTRSLLRLKEYTDELENAETVLFSLALSIEAKDPIRRDTATACRLIPKRWGAGSASRRSNVLPCEERGVVHDVGKIGVPEHVLLKNGPLNDKEWEIMKQHPITGERICSPLKSFRLVLPLFGIITEKLDGSGYPDGLKGDKIPITARVLQITDIYDALITDRPYRAAMTHQKAICTMQEESKRGWWDSNLIKEFEALLCWSRPPLWRRSKSLVVF